MKIKESIPYVILASLAFADILIYFGIVSLFFNGDKTIIAGIIGFLGSIVGGVLTLYGVKLTLENQARKERNKLRTVANTIFIDLLPHLTDVNEALKYYTRGNMSEVLEKMQTSAEKLIEETQRLYPLAIQLNIDFYKNMKSVQYHSQEIVDYISHPSIRFETDQEVYKKLNDLRGRLAIYNSKFDELLREIK